MVAYIEKRCISRSDADTNSTIISNSEGSQYVETDLWDFEETIGDKISNWNDFRRIMQLNTFEACVSDPEEEGGSVHEVDNADRMVTTSW